MIKKYFKDFFLCSALFKLVCLLLLVLVFLAIIVIVLLLVDCETGSKFLSVLMDLSVTMTALLGFGIIQIFGQFRNMCKKEKERIEGMKFESLEAMYMKSVRKIEKKMWRIYRDYKNGTKNDKTKEKTLELTTKKVVKILNSNLMSVYHHWEYGYIYVIGQVVKNLKACYEMFQEVYEKYREMDKSPKNVDDASMFCICYLYSCVLKRKRELSSGNVENYTNPFSKLMNFVAYRFNDDSTIRKEYPLYHELMSRCNKYKEESDFKEALKNDQTSIELYNNLVKIYNQSTTDNKIPPNCALYASFVSTLYRIWEKRNENIDEYKKNYQQKEKVANRYVGKCISFNKKYAKYFFNRAQINFINMNNSAGDSERKELVVSIWNDCQAAIDIVEGKRVDYGGNADKMIDRFSKFRESAMAFMIKGEPFEFKSCLQSMSNNRKLKDENGKEFTKPNEDLGYADDDLGLYIVLDGITRPHAEYASVGDGESEAMRIARIVKETIHGYITEFSNGEGDKRKLLLDAVGEAVKKIKKDKGGKTYAEYDPGAVGLICLISNGRLYYVGLGDCQGMVVRKNAKIKFGKQTAIEALMIEKTTKTDMYENHCNKPENLLSYGIFNGDEAALKCAEVGEFDLYPEDVVFLYSDGMAKYMKYTKSELIVNTDPDRLLSESTTYDTDPYASYADDKIMIKISGV